MRSGCGRSPPAPPRSSASRSRCPRCLRRRGGTAGRVTGGGPGRAAPAEWRPLPPAAAAPERPRLSAGEEEALRLYVAGRSVDEVAQEMSVQFETAKTYLRRVREKYARVQRPASRKVDLMRRAAEDGYLR